MRHGSSHAFAMPIAGVRRARDLHSILLDTKYFQQNCLKRCQSEWFLQLRRPAKVRAEMGCIVARNNDEGNAVLAQVVDEWERVLPA